MRCLATLAFLLTAAATALPAQTPADSADRFARAGEAAFQEGTRAGLERAIAFFGRAFALYRRAAQRTGEATMLHNIGAVHQSLEQPDSAYAYYSLALHVRRAAGDRAGEALTLYNLGSVEKALDRPDSALVHYAAALALQRELGDRVGEAETLNDIGFVYSSVGRPDSALGSYGAALAILRQEGDSAGVATALNNIGLVHDNLGRPDSAELYYRRALPLLHALGDQRGEGTTFNNIGFVHYRVGRPDSALHYFWKALPLVRAAGDRAVQATTLNNIGLVHSGMSRPDSALAYYALALPLLAAVGDRSGVATTLNNIGIVHSTVGRPDSALAYFRRALPILHDAGDRAGEGRTLSNLGSVFRTLGRRDSARSYYARALPLRRAVGDRSGEATTLNNLGTLQERPDSALAYFARALELLQLTGDRSGEARTLSNLGVIHRKLGRSDSAEAYYARALAIQRNVADRSGEASTLGNLGYLHHRRGAPGLRVAIAYYDSAATALAQVAEHAGGDENRLSFAEQDLPLFHSWVLAALALREELGAEPSALAALAAAERGRAQALLDLMRRSAAEARGMPGAPDTRAGQTGDLIAQGRRLAASLAPSGGAALSYLVAGDTLVVWLVSPGGAIEVFRNAIAEPELAAAVASLRRGLGADSAARGTASLEALDRGIGAAPSAPPPAEGGERLAGLLLPAGLRERLRQRLPPGGDLVIVPHGSLNLVPFAALPVDSVGTPLGIRYSVRYSPSLTTLAELPSPKGSGRSFAGALVVGNPAMPRVRNAAGGELALAPLPGAEAEGEWVARRVGVAVLRGTAASEGAVKLALREAPVVHLATHGYAYSSEAKARSSFIALAPGAGQDGLLTVGEVLDELPALAAELVVLSACQTGLGDLKQAEGTVGLQRAFLAKRARSVLVSLWSVSDEATALLMQRFYTHWLGGESKAGALRRAQEEVRGMPGSRFHHPRYWAAFQLVGAS